MTASDQELVVYLQTGEQRPAMARAPVLSSSPASREGFRLERHRPGAFEADNICCLNHLVILHLDVSADDIESVVGVLRSECKL